MLPIQNKITILLFFSCDFIRVILRWLFFFFSIFHRTKPEKLTRAQRPPSVKHAGRSSLCALHGSVCCREDTKGSRNGACPQRQVSPPPTHTHTAVQNMPTLGSVQDTTPGCPKDTGDEEKPPKKFQRPPDINWVSSLHFPSFFKLQLMPGSRLVIWG